MLQEYFHILMLIVAHFFYTIVSVALELFLQTKRYFSSMSYGIEWYDTLLIPIFLSIFLICRLLALWFSPYYFLIFSIIAKIISFLVLLPNSWPNFNSEDNWIVFGSWKKEIFHISGRVLFIWNWEFELEHMLPLCHNERSEFIYLISISLIKKIV